MHWRSKHPIEKAAEFYCFDFEFADEPEDTGLKNNAHTFKDHGDDDLFIGDKQGFSQIIRNIVDQIPLMEGKNLLFDKYVTQIKYNEPGEYHVKVTAKDAKNGDG